jgi:hypothetical protein
MGNFLRKRAMTSSFSFLIRFLILKSRIDREYFHFKFFVNKYSAVKRLTVAIFIHKQIKKWPWRAKKMETFIYPQMPKTSFKGLFLFLIDQEKETWVEEIHPILKKKYLLYSHGNGNLTIPNTAAFKLLFESGDFLCEGEYFLAEKIEIIAKKFGNNFYSLITGKLYESEDSCLFESERDLLRQELKAREIHGSWEWLFLPFLLEEWLEEKKEHILSVLKKMNTPLKSGGLRIIPHDSCGHWGPSQLPMITQIIGMDPNEYWVDKPNTLNKLGEGVFYIKASNQEPKQFTEFYSEWAEVEITRLVALDQGYETNIPFNWEKLEDMKQFFSNATITDGGESHTFGNTGEPCLYLSHPFYEMATGISGYVSRTFLKRYADYQAVGESEHVHFSHYYGWESLPDFTLWPKGKDRGSIKIPGDYQGKYQFYNGTSKVNVEVLNSGTILVPSFESLNKVSFWLRDCKWKLMVDLDQEAFGTMPENFEGHFGFNGVDSQFVALKKGNKIIVPTKGAKKELAFQSDYKVTVGVVYSNEDLGLV